DRRVRGDPARGPLLRLAQRGPAVVLSGPAATVAAAVGPHGVVGSLHDMVVVEVEAEHLIAVATALRDDPATRCDFYSVNAGVDTGSELRSVTFVRGSATGLSVMLRTRCIGSPPHVPSLAGVWPGADW